MRHMLICSAITICLIQLLQAQPRPDKSTGKHEILLLGCFHFDNPGLDVVKVQDANIISPKRQQEVAVVLKKLASFNPDRIFVEIPANRQGKLDTAYQQYLAGTYELKASETQQLGFRLAKMLGHTKLYAIDDCSTDFSMDSVMKVMMSSGQMDKMMGFKKVVDSLQETFNQHLVSMNLQQLLKEMNSPANNAFQVQSYFRFLEAGPIGNHAGADLVSQWLKRNMIIYSNLLKNIDIKKGRTLVIFGSGHTAQLSAMMQYNPELINVQVEKVL